jgi:hypothetical protein
MATKLNQSCINCSIGYLGNRSYCPNESTLSHFKTTKRKSTKWHQRLFKRSAQHLCSSYLSLDVLDDFEYPFNVTVSSFSSELTGSDWSLSSSTTQSSDSIVSQTKHHKNIFHIKSIAQKFKNHKNQAKVVPLWSNCWSSSMDFMYWYFTITISMYLLCTTGATLLLLLYWIFSLCYNKL